MNPDPRQHDPQEGPTMQEVRRARAEVYREDLGRSEPEQRRLEEEMAREYGLALRPPRETPGERPRRTG